jgi:hypothetical protein
VAEAGPRAKRAAELMSEALAASLAEGIEIAATLARDLAERIERGKANNMPGNVALRQFAEMITESARQAELIAMTRRRHDA